MTSLSSSTPETLVFARESAYHTKVISQNDQDVLYAIDSTFHPHGWLTSSVSRRSDDIGKSDLELAMISFVDWNDTRVRFGEESYDLNAFLRRRNIYSNSRIFAAPDGETYKWSIHGRQLELRHANTHALIARSHAKNKYNLLSRKRKHAALEISSDYLVSNILDAIIVTFVIMQHKLNERTNDQRLWY